jgi:hypothetical protein
LKDDCLEIEVDYVGKTCKSYNGICAKDDAVKADSVVYERIQCCYWTDAIKIYDDSKCGLKFNLMGSTTIKWNTGTSLLQCHNKCQEDFQCQSFLHKEAVGYCQLIYHGICTE